MLVSYNGVRNPCVANWRKDIILTGQYHFLRDFPTSSLISTVQKWCLAAPYIFLCWHKIKLDCYCGQVLCMQISITKNPLSSHVHCMCSCIVYGIINLSNMLVAISICLSFYFSSGGSKDIVVTLGLCNPGIPGWIPWAGLKIPVPYTHPPARNAPLSFT